MSNVERGRNRTFNVPQAATLRQELPGAEVLARGCQVALTRSLVASASTGFVYAEIKTLSQTTLGRLSRTELEKEILSFAKLRGGELE